MSGPLAGRVALVTGASRGIGAAIARRLAADGADVTLTYNSSPDAANSIVDTIRAAGGTATAVPADAADSAVVAACVERVATTHGGLDILVNNVGTNIVVPLAEATDEDFQQMIAINVQATFAATRAALPHLRDGGRIINVGSMFAELNPFPGMALYAMAKAAVAGLARGLARELGTRPVTVNTVAPGAIDTDTNPATGTAIAATMTDRTAMGRYASPDEVAAVVAFLAGPDSSFVTGATYHVDGGYLV